MAANKTMATDADVAEFIARVEPAQRRADAERLLALMRAVTGQAPQMWGPTMIGFGAYHYRYESGREGDTFRIGFAPRKPQLVLYLSCDIAEHSALLARLGPHTTGLSCLYIKRLDQVDMAALTELVVAAWTLRGD